MPTLIAINDNPRREQCLGGERHGGRPSIQTSRRVHSTVALRIWARRRWGPKKRINGAGARGNYPTQVKGGQVNTKRARGAIDASIQMMGRGGTSAVPLMEPALMSTCGGRRPKTYGPRRLFGGGRRENRGSISGIYPPHPPPSPIYSPNAEDVGRDAP